MNNQNKSETPVGSDELLASLKQSCTAAAQMADRFKALMEMHARLAENPSHVEAMGERGLINVGKQAHYFMKQLREYFINTDAVDWEDPIEKSWDEAMQTALEKFPLDNPRDQEREACSASDCSPQKI